MNLLHLVQKIESPSNKHRRRVIIEEIAQLGVTPIIDSYSFKGFSGENIMTTFPGKSSKTILLAAHSDTFSGSPGANDDASGCAVLIDMMLRLKDMALKHTVKWLIFDQEELGNIGSQAYVKRYSLGDIVTVFNPELVGRGDALVIWDVVQETPGLAALRYAAQQLDVKVETLSLPLLECDYQSLRNEKISDSLAVATYPSQELDLLRAYMAYPLRSQLKHKVGLMQYPSLFKHYHNSRDRSQFVSKQSLELASDILFEAIQHLDKNIKE